MSAGLILSGAERFDAAREAVVGQQRAQQGIGTLGEKTLHAVLKRYYEPDTSRHEVRIGRYVADIARADGIVEIQTQGFQNLRGKLEAFLAMGPVTVVYPIARLKWLCWMDPATGEVTKRRKSPKAGDVYDAFFELYKIKNLLAEPNLHLRFVLLELTEYRYLDGWSRDGKKGSTRCERIPGKLLGEVAVDTAADYGRMIPPALPARFTAREYAAAAKLRLGAAQTAVHVLHHVGALRRAGKNGRMYVYERPEPAGGEMEA